VNVSLGFAKSEISNKMQNNKNSVFWLVCLPIKKKDNKTGLSFNVLFSPVQYSTSKAALNGPDRKKKNLV
jgi:hypothetical protein